MEELKRLNNGQYAYLRQLPIGKLLELLDVAPVPASCPEDEAYVEALEEVIIEKESERPTGLFPDVDRQWEQFVTHYLPDAEEAALESDLVSEQTNQHPHEVPQKRVVRFSKVRRVALVAAAMAACLLAAMLTAQAAGVDVFEAMAKWTKDIFSFGQLAPDSQVSDGPTQETLGQGAGTPDIGFTSLQEAFDTYGMTAVHEPTWLPEGYTLDSLDVMHWDDPLHVALYTTYANGEDGIGVDVISYEGEPSMQVQKTDAPMEIKEKNGISFYLITNTSSYTVAWYDDQYEYYISGNLSKDILWKTAISMYD